MKALFTIIILLLTSIISACGSSEPSENDISTAIKHQMKAQLEEASGIFKEDDINIRHIKKVGCLKAEGKNGYQCDVDIDLDIKLPFIGFQKQSGIQSLRFVKTDNGWSVVQ